MRKQACALFVVSLIAASAPPPAVAQTPTPSILGLRAFTLDKREAAKGEAVIARYQLTKPAKSVFITATTIDGSSVSSAFPQTATTNANTTAGVITFTLSEAAGTLSPLLMTLSVDGQLRGLQPLLVTCEHAWFFTPRAERCPFNPTQSTPAAIQRFERGAMIWLKATGSIWVLYAKPQNGAWTKPDQPLERFVDAFIEGSPESDPHYVPPSGKQQPVRGFGLIWRTHPMVRNSLGWALEKEQGYTACYGESFGGWRSMRFYITTPDDKLLELESNYQPTRWRELTSLGGKPVQVTGCS